MKRIRECMRHCDGNEPADLLEPAGKAALAAGEIIRALYGQPHKIKRKGDIDLVTEADTAAEEAIIDILEKSPVRAKILSEETRSGYAVGMAEPVWIVDPLDGTTNFAHGFPWFAVSICFATQGKNIMGIIYCPMLDELFCACAGQGAWLNGEAIAVSKVSGLNRALLATGFPYDIQQKPEKVISALKRVLTKAQGVRRAGAAALDLAYVACGRLDGFWEIKLKPWDTAAGQLLVEEAGGRLSDFCGNPYSPFLPEVLATNGRIHDDLIVLLQEFSRQG